MNQETVWASVREAVASNLSEQNLKTWINPLQPLRLEDRTLRLGCPNQFFLAWVREHYYQALVSALESAGSNGCPVDSVELEVVRVPNPPRLGGVSEPRQRELPKIEVHKRRPLRFNRRFTFDRFVVGTANQYAYSASLAMALGQELNTDTLYLLSAPGLGKSHLSQAIGQQMLSLDPRKEVYYLTAEDFTNELIYSIKNKCTEDFKNKYRHGCDVLVLEEVNFLSGKEKIQSELMYTLDCLAGGNKKVVFTSSRLPKDIPRLGRQFASRLSNSLISTIKSPDYETRLRILRKKAKENGLNAPERVLEFLASRLTKDVRQMESCLLSLGAKSRLLSHPINMSLAEEALGDLVEEPDVFDPGIIQETVCRYYKITKEDIQSRSRRKTVVLPRNVGMYLCRKLTDLSLASIGKAFGRHHSTVQYSINVIENRSLTDPKLKNQVEFLAGRVKRGQGL